MSDQQIPSTLNMRMMVVDETGQWVPLKATNDGLNVTATNPRPLTVPEGGTGGTSFTDGSFIIGNAANGFQSVGPGTAGQIPISQGAGADPALTSLSGDGTLSSAGVLALTKSTGPFSLQSTVALEGDIAWTVSADTNDAAPTGLSGASVIKAAASGAGRNITGLTGGADGRVITFINTGSLFLTLKNESASSTAANRFALGSTDISLWTGDSVVLVYDSTASRWRCVAKQVCVPSFAAYPSATTSCGTGSDTQIAMNTDSEADTHGWFNTSTYQYTPLLPGKYLFTWLCTISSTPATAKRFRGSLRKNSSVFKAGAMSQTSVADAIGSGGSAIVVMNGSTDQVDVSFFHDNGSSLNVAAGPSTTYFTGVRVGD